MRYWEDILEPKLEIHLGFRNNRNQGLECCQASLVLAVCEFVVFFLWRLLFCAFSSGRNMALKAPGTQGEIALSFGSSPEIPQEGLKLIQLWVRHSFLG